MFDDILFHNNHKESLLYKTPVKFKTLIILNILKEKTIFKSFIKSKFEKKKKKNIPLTLTQYM